MGIDRQGWFDWAERDPGPDWKRYPGTQLAWGFVAHSMEGSAAAARSRLFGPDAASWTASNHKDGRFVQHYSLFDGPWTSGADYPNRNFFTIESEGVAGEPLTEAQLANVVRAIRDVSEAAGWEPRRPVSAADTDATLYEHRECTRWGAAPTACPSGRYPWDRILAQLLEGEMDLNATFDPGLGAPPERLIDLLRKVYWYLARVYAEEKAATVPPHQHPELAKAVHPHTIT